MHRRASAFVITTVIAPLLAIPISPVANAYPSCDAARAAGAAPIYAGQPGYSRKLDRDGDGVACETGSGGGSVSGGAGIYAPVPLPNQPLPYVPPTQDNPAVGPGTGGVVTTVVNWIGADCIDITAPDPMFAAGILGTNSYCGGTRTFAISPSTADAMVGADPAMGSASSMSCEILSGRLEDSGVAGDGQDVNCLTRLDSLR